MSFERQSRWICAIERCDAALPSPEEMRADIEAKRQCIAEHCEASLRHTIEEEHLYYLDELDKSERMGRRRMARGA